MPSFAITAATLASLLLATSAPAANTTWIFKFGASTFSLGNDTPAGVVGGLALDPPRNSGATYASPSGNAGFVGNDSAEGVSESFANVAQFETIDGNPAAPWSLAQGSSHYTFSADFSAVDPASVPIVTLNSPLAAATTANPPTLHWTTTGTTPLTLLQVSDANFNVDEQFTLPGNFSSFTLPAPLPAGTYNVFISVSSLAVTIPVTTTLVSGPDLAISPEGSFQFADEALSTFVVNPALLGDANTDGTVDLNDLNTVLNNLGQSTSNWTDGNFDGAPTVDLTDLNDVLNNLGTPTATSAIAAAPEPASFSSLRRRRAAPRPQKTLKISPLRQSLSSPRQLSPYAHFPIDTPFAHPFNATMTLLKTLSFSLLLLCAVAFFSTANTHAADAPATAPAPTKKFNVLAFFNATYDQAHINYVHEANVWFPKMGQKHGFTYTATDNWNNLNKSFIADFQVILFLDDSPRDPAQRAAFQEYMENGGGWMGFHVCAFTTNSHEWDWYYNHFLGSGNFRNNTWFPTTALLKVDDPAHPSMNGVPAKFTSCVSEWYSWTSDLAKNPDIDILASVDPACFPLGTDPNQSWYKGYYPIIWSNKKYKMIYANFGHNAMDYKADIGKSSTFASPDQDKFLLNALQWLGSR